MLQRGADIYCGVFDSVILRRDERKSEDRTVQLFELELFHTDSGVSYVNGEQHPCRRGMLLCAKPGQVRHSEFPVRCSFIRIAAGKDADIDRILRSAPDCFYIDEESKILELLTLFERLGALSIGNGGDAEQVQINAKFAELLWRAMRLWQENADTFCDAPAGRLTRDAYEYINEHYTERCTLADIAMALHVSPNHLHAVFKRETGKTPLAHVQFCRVEKAKKLILAGEHSMLEIALETGFSSQSHFNRTFKGLTGTTPARWRKNLIRLY